MSKSPSEDFRARMRTTIRAVVVEDFDGNQTRAAEALGVRQATISNILNPHKAADVGLKVWEALYRYDVQRAVTALGVDVLDGPAAKAAETLVQEGYVHRLATWAAQAASVLRPDDPLDAARLLLVVAQALGEKTRKG